MRAVSTPAHPRGRPLAPSLAAGIVGLVLVVGVVASGAASGAASTTRGRPAQPRSRITVVAAENFWGSIVKQLAGTRANVTSIITNPATDPHSYEAKPSDSRTIASATYMIINGLGYDPWAQKAVDANPADGRKVLVVGNILGLKDGDNPHQWYSPDSVQRFIDRVTRDLQQLDPKGARYYAAQRTTFESVGLAQYHSLVAQIRQKYTGTPIGASESIVSPLATSLGLNVLTPATFLRAIAEGTDPTVSDKQTINRQITTKQVKVFMFNSQNATPDVQAIVKQANAALIPVTTMTETLAPANTTFQSWQVKQLLALQAALTKATGS